MRRPWELSQTQHGAPGDDTGEREADRDGPWIYRFLARRDVARGDAAHGSRQTLVTAQCILPVVHSAARALRRY